MHKTHNLRELHRSVDKYAGHVRVLCMYEVIHHGGIQATAYRGVDHSLPMFIPVADALPAHDDLGFERQGLLLF